MKEKFLLHTCCAPCSIVIVEELKDKFDLTVFFYNPNIFPEEEYIKRKGEVIKVCENWKVKMVDKDYKHGDWRQAIKGLEAEPEIGMRCSVCFYFRLTRAAKFAAENKFDWFGTSLTSGRNKKSVVIHPIAKLAADKFGIKFYEEDWKKSGRQERGRMLVKQRGIYRQDYCGCEFSLATRNQSQINAS